MAQTTVTPPLRMNPRGYISASNRPYIHGSSESGDDTESSEDREDGEGSEDRESSEDREGPDDGEDPDSRGGLDDRRNQDDGGSSHAVASHPDGVSQGSSLGGDGEAVAEMEVVDVSTRTQHDESRAAEIAQCAYQRFVMRRRPKAPAIVVTGRGTKSDPIQLCEPGDQNHPIAVNSD